jgi:putative ABC transport system ATP-binding protein
MVDVRNVTKRYEGKRTVHALRDVTFRVEKGEMVATMGPSGCGKSTLLNILSGLDRASEGSVIIDGIDLSTLNDNALTRLRREKVGFVFQFFNLLPTLTALENTALPLHLAGIPRREAATRAMELLRIVGLEDRHDHLPDELSGGEQQRVAMARALVLRPPLILADEPTGNLDSQSGAEIMQILDQLHQRGRTLIIVTHDPQVAARTQRTIHLLDGRIEREENHYRAPLA